MRSTLLLLLSVVVLAGFFAAYLATQKAPAKRGPASTLPTTVPNPRETVGSDPLVGPGDDLWARTYDRSTGRLTLEFHAEQYEPQADGTVAVTLPEARFHLREGRYIAVSAASGRVVLSGGAGSARQLSQGRGGTPSRGELRDVTIELFESLRATAPTLTCTLPLVSFDNDTFRIATEATVIDGQPVPADRAPVRVVGEDLQFEGRGLVLRWNGMTGQLDSLEIAHGERLTIRPGSELFPNPLVGAMSPFEPVASAEPIPPPATRRKRKLKPVGDPTAPPAPPAFYRAMFLEQVRVSEGEQPVASGRVLEIDFMVAESGTTGAERAAEQGASAPVKRPTRGRGRPASSPSPTEPDDRPPVTIRWVGPLRVQPLHAEGEDPADRLKHPEDRIVRLSGEPAELSRDGSSARFAELRYRTGEETIVLLSSRDCPTVELRDRQGTSIRGPSIAVNRVTGVASIDRGGDAEVPVDEAGSVQAARVAWTDRCDLVFRERDGRAVVESVALLGAVRLRHPRLALDADELSLSFEPAEARAADATSPTASVLRLARAVGNARAAFADAHGRTGSLDAGEVSIGMATPADGASFVRTLSAEGNVLLKDDRQSLRCDRVSALFDPPGNAGQAPRRALEPGFGGDARLSSFRATGNVRWTDTDAASTASGAELAVSVIDGDTQVALLGDPAIVKDRDGTLEGPRIEFEPDADRGRVVGGGKLQARDPAGEGSLSVRWRDRIDYDGRGNLAELSGEVVAERIAPDGSRQTASAGRVTMHLAAGTRPPSATQPEGLSPATGTGSLVDARPLGNRQVRQVIFRERVELASVLEDAAGKLLQRTTLQAEEVRYDLEGRRLDVPVAGRMLHEDERPADPRLKEDLVGDLRGATAFQWREQFTFDEPAMAARLVGQVRMVQRRGDQPPVTLNAAEVDAEFAPDSPASTRRASLLLKRVVASGDVNVTAPQARFSALKLEFDPGAGQVIAVGTASQPVETFDEQGLSQGGFERLIYNTRTRQIDKLEKPVGRIRR